MNWNLVYRASWVAFVIVLIVGAVAGARPKWEQYRDYQRRQSRLQEEARLQEEMLHALKEKQQRFHDDPVFLEQIAHDLGLAKPGEVIIRFPDPAASTNANPAPR